MPHVSRAIVIAAALIGERAHAQASSAGPTIPNVVGQTVQAATSMLAITKLPVVTLDTATAAAPSGTVIAQRPPAGTLAARVKEVAILVARAPKRVPPPVDTSPRDTAVVPPPRVDTPPKPPQPQPTPTPTPTPPSTPPSTPPPQPTPTPTPPPQPTPTPTAPPRPTPPPTAPSTPAPTQIIVPDLTGMTQTDAQRALAADSLSLGSVVPSRGGSTATVVAQQPGAGERVTAHSFVSIRLAGPAPSRQPIDTANDTNVRANDTGHGGTRTTGRGTAGGTIVPTVRTVPDLVGRTERSARSTADDDHFLMAVNNRRRRLAWHDAVIAQTPVAGAPAPTDRTIAVELAIPVVPPVPAAIALGVLGVTGETLRRRRRHRHHTDQREVAYDVDIPSADAPSLSPLDGDRLIRSSVEFLVDPGTPTWNVASAGDTLIKTEKPHDA